MALGEELEKKTPKELAEEARKAREEETLDRNKVREPAVVAVAVVGCLCEARGQCVLNAFARSDATNESNRPCFLYTVAEMCSL